MTATTNLTSSSLNDAAAAAAAAAAPTLVEQHPRTDDALFESKKDAGLNETFETTSTTSHSNDSSSSSSLSDSAGFAKANGTNAKEDNGIRTIPSVDINNNTCDKSVSMMIYQYDGPIGVGARSILAEQPLPKPTTVRKQVTQKMPDVSSPSSSSSSSSKRGLWRRRNSKKKKNTATTAATTTTTTTTTTGTVTTWQPFAATSDDSDSKGWVSYFEVNLLEPIAAKKVETATNKEQEQEPKMNVEEPGKDEPYTHHLHECVSVGISLSHPYTTKHMAQSMPGWQRHSYGYHGDDGLVLAHASRGANTKKLLPTFGMPGDVIGCGIQYTPQDIAHSGGGRIFYTRNGNLVGYQDEAVVVASSKQPLDFYPTIGIDSNKVSVQFNTTGPFAFDLADMVHKVNNGQEVAVSTALLPTPTTTNDGKDDREDNEGDNANAVQIEKATNNNNNNNNGGVPVHDAVEKEPSSSGIVGEVLSTANKMGKDATRSAARGMQVSLSSFTKDNQNGKATKHEEEDGMLLLVEEDKQMDRTIDMELTRNDEQDQERDEPEVQPIDSGTSSYATVTQMVMASTVVLAAASAAVLLGRKRA